MTELHISRIAGAYIEVSVNLDTALVYLASALQEEGLSQRLRRCLTEIRSHLQAAKSYFNANKFNKGYYEVKTAGRIPLPPS